MIDTQTTSSSTPVQIPVQIKPEMVTVQLTPAGVALAAGGPLRASGVGQAFSFEPGVAVTVERVGGWLAILRHQTTPKGDSIFELVPPSQASSTL